MAKPALKKALTELKLEEKLRNGLERKVAKQLQSAGIKFAYEEGFVTYEVPARTAKYLPDFKCPGNIIIESKGHFGYKGDAKDAAAQRQKYALLKEQHPGLDIRFVFSRAATPIYKGSKTTHGKWATDHGFPWADDGNVPPAWIIEMKKHKQS